MVSLLGPPRCVRLLLTGSPNECAAQVRDHAWADKPGCQLFAACVHSRRSCGVPLPLCWSLSCQCVQPFPEQLSISCANLGRVRVCWCRSHVRYAACAHAAPAPALLRCVLASLWCAGNWFVSVGVSAGNYSTALFQLIVVGGVGLPSFSKPEVEVRCGTVPCQVLRACRNH